MPLFCASSSRGVAHNGGLQPRTRSAYLLLIGWERRWGPGAGAEPGPGGSVPASLLRSLDEGRAGGIWKSHSFTAGQRQRNPGNPSSPVCRSYSARTGPQSSGDRWWSVRQAYVAREEGNWLKFQAEVNRTKGLCVCLRWLCVRHVSAPSLLFLSDAQRIDSAQKRSCRTGIGHRDIIKHPV